MFAQSEAEIGATVYLRPFTKTAPAECYRRLAAVVMSYERWPMVRVRLFDVLNDGHGREIMVHRDNIGLRRRTIKRDHQGDMIGNEAEGNVGMVGKPIGRKPKPLTLPDGGEEPTLF